MNEPLAVITVISNPVRYESRYRLYREFAQRMRDDKVPLYTVELAYGYRPWEVTEPNNPYHIQLRTPFELWHKENMINRGIARILEHNPKTWGIGWIDADVQFVRRDWLMESWHALQHHEFVQPFSHAIDMGPELEVIQTHKGFCYSYVNGLQYGKAYSHWHPGFGWFARTSALNRIGGLIDRAILGAGDHHMALSLIGRGNQSYPGNVHPNYKKMILGWEERAAKYVKRNVGYVPGTLLHHWHGKKKDRRYVERWDIITRFQYDPVVDVEYDMQGILRLDDDGVRLRDPIAAYFRQRNEDSIDLE